MMEAGLSTTSPAAIRWVSVSGRTMIFPGNFPPPIPDKKTGL
jgi:hypothetical protein